MLLKDKLEPYRLLLASQSPRREGADGGLRPALRTGSEIRVRGDLPRLPARRRGAAVPLAAQKRGLPRAARPERHSADGRHGGDLRRRGAGQALRPRAGRADAPPPFGTPTHGRFGRDAAHRRPHAHLLGRKRRLVPTPLGRRSATTSTPSPPTTRRGPTASRSG